MKMRKDGEATRESILNAASQVFATKGYHKATHVEISQEAGVNTALINFHFGSKDELYHAVWERVDREIEQLYPIDGGVPEDAPAPERLRGFISCLLNRALDPRLEGFHRILSMEVLNPTGLIDRIMMQRRKEHHSHLLAIIRELLEPDADEKSVEICKMSVISQCHIIIPHHTRRFAPRYKHTDVESLTEHITTFSLAGIEAIHKQTTERTR
jgi:TetR/AcrR family transcriptional regulator, regulator of cefoperazone and chloramphenicol sensitivity